MKRLRDLLLRLRAALTPQALIVLALLLLGMGFAQKGDSRTALEKRTEEALAAVSGAGKVQVVIRMREAPRQNSLASASTGADVPCGAVVVAQGASDPWVQIQLQASLATAFAIVDNASQVPSIASAPAAP